MRAKAQGNRHRYARVREVVLQTLEARVLFSSAGAPLWLAFPEITGLSAVEPVIESDDPLSAPSPTPIGLTPQQVRGAYGLGQYGSHTINFTGNIEGDGSGQTVAVVIAYDYPTALADLQAYSTQFGLPAPNLTILNQSGAASPLPAAETGSTGWALEGAIDLQAVHAMAPKADLVLVETNSTSMTDLTAGAFNIRNRAGLSVVSMSWGSFDELPTLAAFDGAFTTPAGHNGVTFVAGSGDTGVPASYPAVSQNVVAVGGTTLNVSGNSYVSETGWSGSGGGYSAYQFQPSFQSSTISSTQRSTPDVSMVGDPSTGMAIRCAYAYGAATPWGTGAGTSLATPLFSGIIAVANQGRLLNGLTTLDGGSQTLPLIYGLGAGNFHDITTGSNPSPAGPGYDLVTGRGSPIANLMIPALATAAAPTPKPDIEPRSFGTGAPPLMLSLVSGTYTEPAMITPGTSVFLSTAWQNPGAVKITSSFNSEVFRNGVSLATLATSSLDVGSPNTILNLNIGAIAAGVTEFKTVLDTGNTVAESTETDNIFVHTFVVDNTNGRTFTLRLDAAGSNIQIFQSGTASAIYSIARTSLHKISFYLSGANQTLTIDPVNGNPMPANGLTVRASPGAGSNLQLFTSGGSDRIGIDAAYIRSNGAPINYAGFSSILISTGGGDDMLTQTAQPTVPVIFNGGTGSDTLYVTGGTFTFSADASIGTSFLYVAVGAGGSVNFNSTQHLWAMYVRGTATVAAGGGRFIRTSSLVIPDGGRLDLNDNDLIYDYSGVNPQDATVRGFIGTARAGGAWTGDGITSSAARDNPGHTTTLGYMEASTYKSLYGAASNFDNESLDDTAVVVRYTLYGDANLDRSVESTDYSMLASHLGQTNQPWAAGDFTYEGTVDTADRDLLYALFSKTLLSPLASVTGTLFNDANVNGIFDGGDSALNGRVVFFDVNGNGAQDAGEPTRTTDGLGHYTFSAMGPGSYALRQVLAAGVRQTAPANAASRAVALGLGEQRQSVDFGSGTTPFVARRLFYNNSALDGNNAAANTADDNAIDPTKSPLRSGGSVTSANVSGYAKGINGIMIDVATLPAGAGPTASDFSFRAATTGGWGAGPVPSSVTVRRGVSTGIDRMTLIWNNAAPNAPVLNGWLEVTMKANAVTGLSTADVFTFGNLVGDANGDRAVTVGDLGLLATNFNKPSGATIAQGDYNGDGAVTVGDLGILSTAFGRTLALPPAGLLSGDTSKPTTGTMAIHATTATTAAATRTAIRGRRWIHR